MKPLLLALAFLALFFPIAIADEVSVQIEGSIKVGMNRDALVAVIKKHSAKDITFNLDIAENVFGDGTATGLYWSFRDYDAIIEIRAKDGKVTSINFWTKKDFANKHFASEKAQKIKSLKFEPAKKVVAIEKE